MNPAILILIVGFSFIILFGGYSLLRREAISMRFVLEGLAMTFLASGIVVFTGIALEPLFFLIILYLLTMRVRLLIDMGNLFARQSRFTVAQWLYALALRVWPDQPGELIVSINQATALLQQEKVDEAIALLQEVLRKAGQGYLGVKYESAAHYNLGVAYLRKKMETLATFEFNAVLDTWPASEYARRATIALEQRRQRSKAAQTMPKPDEKS